MGARDRRPDQGARRLEGDDDDLDLRPPGDPGRRVGLVPAPASTQLLQGEDDFYESVAEALGIPTNLVTNAHAASASAPPLGAARRPAATAAAVAGEPDRELLQAVQAATSLLKAYRTHGHLAANVNPLGGEPKGDPALEPENLNLTPELMAQIPASILRIGVEGETLLDALPRMRDAYCGRSPTRSSTSPRTSSGCGCAR